MANWKGPKRPKKAAPETEKPAERKIRNWGTAKSDMIWFRKKRIKLYVFVRIVASSLPRVTVAGEGSEEIDHEQRLKDAYCEAGLEGMNQYENSIWLVKTQYDNKLILMGLSKKATSAIQYHLGETDYEGLMLGNHVLLSKMDRSAIAKIRGVGAGTLKELDEMMVKFGIDWISKKQPDGEESKSP